MSKNVILSFPPGEQGTGKEVEIFFNDLHELMRYLHDTYDTDWTSVQEEAPAEQVAREIELAYAEYNAQLEAEVAYDGDDDFSSESVYDDSYAKDRGKRSKRLLCKRREKRHIRKIDWLLEKKAAKEERDSNEKHSSTRYRKRSHHWKKQAKRLSKRVYDAPCSVEEEQPIDDSVVEIRLKRFTPYVNSTVKKALEIPVHSSDIRELRDTLTMVLGHALQPGLIVTCYFKGGFLGII